MAWSYLDTDVPFGMAHRGGSSGGPENTVAAFRRATELGYRHLETDVHATSDGVLVAFHDDDLQRVAGLPGGIGDYRWDRLAEIELADGHRIPTMDELLTTFPDARFNIDPKSDQAVDPLIELIGRHGAVGRVCIGSFSESRISRVRHALGPELCTSPGPGGLARVLAAAYLSTQWSPPYGCLQIPIRARGIQFDRPALIARFQQLGLQVHFWTINERSEMERLLDAGADAIISDELEILNEVLAARRAGR
jgi:glycerophosphoryl diester phosphodiesterase